MRKLISDSRSTGASRPGDCIDVPEGGTTSRELRATGNRAIQLRNGCCTTCAVRVMKPHRTKVISLPLHVLRAPGYCLLCVASGTDACRSGNQTKTRSTNLQFGRFSGGVRSAPSTDRRR